ncbi:hypothetical protein NWE60_02990 [Mycoplasmopsis felis]|nr:hypothetical protein [Mycoplasmopsis felis]WAM01540.1 hypothetical protein NWE60_02990 [Mycoplasmopsis felis]
MTKKLKKYLLSFAGISLTTALTVAASCGSDAGSEKPVNNRELVLDLKDQVDWKLSRLTSETNYEELKQDLLQLIQMFKKQQMMKYQNQEKFFRGIEFSSRRKINST